jgi:hypothetical protein
MSELVAARDDFELSCGPDRSDNDWQPLTLISTKRGAIKRVWYLGWNQREQRLARNRDRDRLRKRFPGIDDWIVNELRQRPEVVPVTAEHAADVDDAAIASAASAHAAVPADIAAVDARRAESLADAVEAENRWNEMQAAKQRAIEEQRRRESENNAAWRQQQFNAYVVGMALPGINPFTGRPRSIWDDMPPPTRLYR